MPTELRKPKTPEVRALAHAGTELLIARRKELYPERDELRDEVVCLTCALDPEVRRRFLIADILEAELHNTELARLWGKVCDEYTTPYGPDHGKGLMVTQILEAELGPFPHGR